MNPSTSGAIDNVDIDGSSQMRQTKTLSNTAKLSQSPTSLVIDDHPNSEDSSMNTPKHSSKSISLTIAQTSHYQRSAMSLTSTLADQQRRRNSFIAKLLGGHSLHNQQYEDITQQILDDQSAQSLNNNGENGIQRSRSSITRNLLMKTERNHSHLKTPSKPQVPSASSLSKDFEYLIRRELDAERTPATLQRNGYTPTVFQNLNSSSITNAQPNLKRKRSISKLPLSIALIQSAAHVPPFALHNPFELDPSPTGATTNSIPSIARSPCDQTYLLPFNPSAHPYYQNSAQYGSSVNNLSSHSFHKLNSHYNQFNIQHDRVSGNQRSSSCHYTRHPPSKRSAVPSPVLSLLAPAVGAHDNSNATANLTHQPTSMLFRVDSHEIPRQRSYSHLSNQSNTTSCDPNVPLKKRLLHAFLNEQGSTSLL